MRYLGTSKSDPRSPSIESFRFSPSPSTVLWPGGTDDRSPPLLQYTLTFSSSPYLTLLNYYLHHLLRYPTGFTHLSSISTLSSTLARKLSTSVNTRSVQLARRFTLSRRYNASNGLPRLTLSASLRFGQHHHHTIPHHNLSSQQYIERCTTKSMKSGSN